MSKTFKINTPEEMIAYGNTLASTLHAGDVVFLQGDLGAGKTTLVRGLLNALGYGGKVKSPTFTLVEPYHLNNMDIYHFDLYRLNDPSELEDIGFRDYVQQNTLCLIEWPEKASGFLPKPTNTITINSTENTRILTVTKTNEEMASF